MNSRSAPLTFALLVSLVLNSAAVTHYVDLNSPSPTAPYTNWLTAATNIQDAVDVAVAGETVLVTNGIYAAGGRTVDGLLTNRVAVTKAISLLSVNGPAVTQIHGYQVPTTVVGTDAIRCVYLTNGSFLSGFTMAFGATRGLTNGEEQWDIVPDRTGGGVFGISATISNCVLLANAAHDAGGGANGVTVTHSRLFANTAIGLYGFGAGAFNSTLNNCLVVSNTAFYGGGGVGLGGLTNCTLTGNTSTIGSGGGAVGAAMFNSVIYHNSPDNYTFGEGHPPFEFCCTTPLPAWGVGHFTTPPHFVDPGNGDYRLQEDSPCVDAGNNNYSFGGTDLGNGMRIVNGLVDVGAYELPYPRIPRTRYVDVNNPTPIWPYTNWTTAATTIQDAADTAFNGETVLVTNGIYEAGASFWGMTNRIVVRKPVLLQSVNGPASTIIKGYQVPITTNAPQSIRCAYLANGATLSGFTLTQGSTAPGNPGGGVFSDNTGIVTNCVLLGNTSGGGGGAHTATLIDCQLIGNRADVGGGVAGGMLDRCVLKGNHATAVGGAVYGLPYLTVLNNCLVVSNSAGANGAAGYGDDDNPEYLVFRNCTIVGNSCSDGAGVVYGVLQNCIIHGNIGAHEYGSYMDGCCIAGDPGPGNIADAPLLVDPANGDYRLQTNSPCIHAGKDIYVTTSADLDGNPRIFGPHVDIGAFEYPLPTPLALNVNFTNVAAGFPVSLSWRTFAGNVSQLILDYGDGLILTNNLAASHTWNTPGIYNVVLTAFSDAYPTGVSVSLVLHVFDGTLFVSQGNANPVAPYSSWSTAATNIQDAVDAAPLTGIVIVSNGVYQTGARTVPDASSNRLVIAKPLKLQSVNGPSTTIIDGGNTVRCLYLSHYVSVSGFTLRNGRSPNGAGVYCESQKTTLTDCILTNNQSLEEDTYGGGALRGTLENCALIGNIGWFGGASAFSSLADCILSNNTALAHGGGAYGGILNRCLVAGNSATWGGGCSAVTASNSVISGNYASEHPGGADASELSSCTVVSNAAGSIAAVENSVARNSIIYYNGSQNEQSGSTFESCCVTPHPGGIGNVTNPPQFVDLSARNFRLLAGSPCINAGSNAFVATASDADGRPRIYNGTVDMGAYEFQSTNLNTFIGWLQQNGLIADGSADFVDADGDGANNWHEWRADTLPTNAASALAMEKITNGATGLVVRWASAATRNYWLERSTNFAAAPFFHTIGTNLPGVAGTKTYNDTTATNGGPYFYRVGVQ